MAQKQFKIAQAEADREYRRFDDNLALAESVAALVGRPLCSRLGTFTAATGVTTCATP